MSIAGSPSRTPVVESPTRPFEIGTTGWTAADLDDPAIEREWFSGRYEIVEGVLTKMPPAYYKPGRALRRLTIQFDRYCETHQIAGEFSMEADIILNDQRVVVADAAFMTPNDDAIQSVAARRAGYTNDDRSRIVVPPMLVIESASAGHELHDERVKRRWYAEFGIKNYWILNPTARRLECLVLDAAAYRVDASGSGTAILHPSAFAGLDVTLAALWG